MAIDRSQQNWPEDDFPNDFLADWSYLDETDDFDFEDVDCDSCGLKFYIRPSLYNKASGKPFPTQCERCRKGLPPLYEY